MINETKDESLTPEEVSSKTGQPLFRVRSGLRELKNAGFVEEKEGKYTLSEAGKSILR
jgi:predicted transcriptional regulator